MATCLHGYEGGCMKCYDAAKREFSPRPAPTEHTPLVSALEHLVAERDRLRAMDDARVAGFGAFGEGKALHENPDPRFGPDAHKGDAWESGYLLAAGNAARAALATAEAEARTLRNAGVTLAEERDAARALAETHRIASVKMANAWDHDAAELVALRTKSDRQWRALNDINATIRELIAEDATTAAARPDDLTRTRAAAIEDCINVVGRWLNDVHGWKQLMAHEIIEALGAVRR